MSKHKRTFKILTASKTKDFSSIRLSRELGVTCSQIRYWSAVYRIHGDNAFLHTERPYTKYFKLSVIETMKNENWSLRHTCAYFDLSSPGILSQWLKVYNQPDSDYSTPRKKGRPKMKKAPSAPEDKPSENMSEQELRDELEYLRTENAVLKKFEALAQEKKDRTKKKR